jgi:hypothetical protein
MGQAANQTFTAAGSGNAFGISPGNSLEYSVSGTYSGVMVFERSRTGGQSWEPVQVGASGQVFSGTVANEGTFTLRFRWRSAVATGTAETTIADVNNVVQRITNREGVDRVVVSDDGVDLVGDVTVNGGPIGSGGASLPAGGAAGQVLTKQSAVDGDAVWSAQTPGPQGPPGTVNSLVPAGAIELWVPGIGMELDGTNVQAWRGVYNNYTLTKPSAAVAPTYDSATRQVTIGNNSSLETAAFPSADRPRTVVMYLFIETHQNFARIFSFASPAFLFYQNTAINALAYSVGGQNPQWNDFGPSTSMRAVICEVQDGATGANYFSGSSTAYATANQNAGTGQIGGIFRLKADTNGSRYTNSIRVGAIAIYNRVLTTQEKNDIIAFCDDPSAPLPFWGSMVGNPDNDPVLPEYIENKISASVGPVFPDVGIAANGDATSALNAAFAGSNRYIQLVPWSFRRTDPIKHPLSGHFDGRGATLQPTHQMLAGESHFDVNFAAYDSLVPMQSGSELIIKDLHLSGQVGANDWGRSAVAIADTEQIATGIRWTGGFNTTTHANNEVRNLTVGKYQVGFDFRAFQFNRTWNTYSSNCQIGHLIRNNPRGGGGTDTTYALPKINNDIVGMMFLNESASGFSDLQAGGILPMLNNDIEGPLFHQPTHSAVQMLCYEDAATNIAQIWGGKISEYLVGNNGWDDSNAGDVRTLTIGEAVNPVPTGPYSGAVRAAKTLSFYSAAYGVQAGHLILQGVTCDDGRPTRVFWLGSAHARVDAFGCKGGGNVSQPLVHSTDPTGSARVNFHGACGYPGFAEAVGRRPDSLMVGRATPNIFFFLQMLGRRGYRPVDASLIGPSATTGPSKLGRGAAVDRVTPVAFGEALQGSSAVTTIAASASAYSAASNAAWGHDATVIQFRTMQTPGAAGNRSRARINIASQGNTHRYVGMIGVRNPTESPIRCMIEFVTGFTSLHFAGQNQNRPFYYTLQPGVIYDLVAFVGQKNLPVYVVISPWTNDDPANWNFDIEVSEPEYYEGEQELLDRVFHTGVRASVSGSSGP